MPPEPDPAGSLLGPSSGFQECSPVLPCEGALGQEEAGEKTSLRGSPALLHSHSFTAETSLGVGGGGCSSDCVTGMGPLPRNLIPPTVEPTKAGGGSIDGLFPAAHFTGTDTEAQGGGLAGSGLSARLRSGPGAQAGLLEAQRSQRTSRDTEPGAAHPWARGALQVTSGRETKLGDQGGLP
ncbi:hypothetical protein VULLAG_LOCUS18089 [Vulpes lagopus]